MVSHTTTGEWQSFEVRMRRRRAERLLLRAEAAVDEGRLDDARLCLSEAKGLVPDMPGLEAVEHRLQDNARGVTFERSLDIAPPFLELGDLALPSPEPPAARGRRRTVVAAAVIAVIATILFAAWPRGSRRDVPAETAAVPAPTTPAPAAVTDPTRPEPEPTPAEPLPSPAEALPPPASVFTSEIAALPGPEKPRDKPVDPEPVRGDAPANVKEPADVPRVSHVDPIPAPENTPGRVMVPAPPPTPVAAPATAAGLALPIAADPPPAAPPAPPEPSQEPAVRSALDRYASAYNALDVEAAQRVWPGVNRGALARAFDSLASQEIALGDCRINVAASSATARCAGTASWAPKVGDGGRRTEARQWTFELARGAAGWEIVNARVQNR